MRQAASIRGWMALGLLGCALGFGGAPAQANPESATVQSALTWRVDGSGDYPLPHLTQGTYASPQVVPTSGQVKALTATWTFEGQVTLELSADGGLHYAQAVNGVPLTSGFMGGNRLKWRAALSPDSQLTEVRLSYADSSGVVGTFGQPELSGFRYRKAIAIKGPASGELFNNQIKLLIGESARADSAEVHCEGRIRSDFADLRFTAADGATLLPHYRERLDGTSPNRVATVWVKIPHIPREGLVIYLYYGNGSARDLSNGRAVFDFFDDFTGQRLDPELWKVKTDGQGSVTVSASQLHLSAASVLSAAFQVKDHVVEVLASTKTDQDDARLIIRSDPAASSSNDTSQVAYASMYQGAEHVLAVGNIVKANDPKPLSAGTSYGYRVRARGTRLVFERYDPAFIHRQASVEIDDANGLTAGTLGLRSDGAASYDWIRVRKEASLEPPVMATGTALEESVQLPVFTNIAVAPNGNLTLVDGAPQGVYQSAGVSTSSLTRIVALRWQGNVASTDLSANGGLSYRVGCANGSTYYAAKGEFTAGRRVQYRLAMARGDSQALPELQAMTLDYDPGEVTLVSPNGKEQWVSGTTQQIIWTAVGHERTYPMKLGYSLDGGKTYQDIASPVRNEGAYLWSLPAGMSSERALVRVSDGHDRSVLDASDHVFSIIAAGVGRAPQALSSIAQPQSASVATSESVAPGDLAKLLEELSRDPRATAHELLIKTTDASHPDPNKDALSYKAGDVVLIRPAGAEWSETEKHSFLIIQANLTPEAVAMLMSSLEIPTGEVTTDGKPVMRMMGRRKFHIDLDQFDLAPKPADQGRPAVLRHFRKQEKLSALVEERKEGGGIAPTGLAQ
ncbi:MAG: DUF2341 domain-containing protein [Candidatus Omnitrophica bacterium]|nr:DUF2341 domain-containing protein [Candidatus Omnitrophota bacterium]MBI3020827.1 DUF2341 domain-containing protein [Candidatus Omnitrophota bacterium]MBI3083595.1 DUF2341 domain-containing protein [Candidatus Omnitrophota bacterium]